MQFTAHPVQEHFDNYSLRPINMHMLGWFSRFLPRDAMHKRGLCRHAVSVRLFVCYVRVFCQKRVIVSSNFFTTG